MLILCCCTRHHVRKRDKEVPCRFFIFHSFIHSFIFISLVACASRRIESSYSSWQSSLLFFGGGEGLLAHFFSSSQSS
jgi:hypothetical protein